MKSFIWAAILLCMSIVSGSITLSTPRGENEGGEAQGLRRSARLRMAHMIGDAQPVIISDDETLENGFEQQLQDALRFQREGEADRRQNRRRHERQTIMLIFAFAIMKILFVFLKVMGRKGQVTSAENP